MSMVTKNEKIVVKTIEQQFQNPNINVHLHFWSSGATEYHSHEFFELFLITEGKIRHKYNGETTLLSQNTLGVVVPGKPHQFLSYESQPAVHCNLRLTPTLFQTLCSVINPSLYELLLSQNGLIKYKLTAQEMEHILHYISTAQFTFDHVSDENYASVATVVAATFLLYLNTSLKTQQVYPKWFSAFLNKLNSVDAFSKPLSVLYKESGYSQTALNAYFKKYMGKTLVSYMIERKINYACNLLNTTDYSVLQIALMASFNNLSNFNSNFKKIIGMTPTQYRQKKLLSPRTKA